MFRCGWVELYVLFDTYWGLKYFQGSKIIYPLNIFDRRTLIKKPLSDNPLINGFCHYFSKGSNMQLFIYFFNMTANSLITDK